MKWTVDATIKIPRATLELIAAEIIAQNPPPDTRMCTYRETKGEHWGCVRPLGHRGEHSPFVVDAENADEVRP